MRKISILLLILLSLIFIPCANAASDGWDMMASDKLQHFGGSATASFILSSFLERNYPDMSQWKRAGISAGLVFLGGFIKEVRDKHVGDIISEGDLVADGLGSLTGVLFTIKF